MCGIAGFISPARADAAALAPMLARIAHRGPDGQGTFVEGPAALGHCRLAIIDLQGGAQPLYSEDKNFVVVFNGEIYNYRELTAELTALGHTFTTRTDTEVLLHGWEQWGRELLPRLRGMFAFALWDRRAQVLFPLPEEPHSSTPRPSSASSDPCRTSSFRLSSSGRKPYQMMRCSV